jgi:hypothetical protein
MGQVFRLHINHFHSLVPQLLSLRAAGRPWWDRRLELVSPSPVEPRMAFASGIAGGADAADSRLVCGSRSRPGLGRQRIIYASLTPSLVSIAQLVYGT